MRNELVRWVGLALVAVGCGEVSEINFGDISQAVTPPRPDLVLVSVTGPEIALGPFAGAVEVCNRGTLSSLASTVNVYLSRDKRIDGPSSAVPDPIAGTIEVPALFPGQCRRIEGRLVATVPADARYVICGAVDEANAQVESNERNNTFFGAFVYSGSRPELFIASLRAPLVASFVGEPFPIEVRVCNQGTIPARASTLGLYRSADATITTAAPDITLATLNTPALQVGECVDLAGSYPWNGPGPTAYVGAIVDPRKREPELNETNNIASSRVDETQPSEALVVEALTASLPDEPFWRQARICSMRTEPLGGSVDVVGSADPLLVSPLFDPLSTDQLLDMSFWFQPQPLECRDLPIGFNHGYRPGGDTLSYFGVTSSWLLPGAAIPTARLPTYGGLLSRVDLLPNFSIRSVEARRSNGDLQVTIEACAENEVDSMTAIQLFVSDDRTLDMGVPWADRDGGTLPAVMEMGCHRFLRTLSGPVPPTAYVLARIDPSGGIAELSETDNDRWSAEVPTELRPNLVITSAEFPVAATSPAAVRVRVCNQGEVLSPATSVGVYLEHDRTLPGYGLVAPGSLTVGQVAVPSLAPGDCVEPRANFPLPNGTGGWRWRAVVDPTLAVVEGKEDDNTRAGSWIGLGAGPDLVVTAVRAAAAFPSVFTSYEVEVCNVGDQVSAATTVTTFGTVDRVLEPRGRNLGPTELPMGSVVVPGLLPGACTLVVALSDNSNLVGVNNLPMWTAAWVNDSGTTPERTTRNNGAIGPRWSQDFPPPLRIRILAAPRGLDVPNPRIEVEVCNDAPRATSASVDVRSLSWEGQSRWEAPLALSWTADPNFSLAPGGCERRSLALEPLFRSLTPVLLSARVGSSDLDRTDDVAVSPWILPGVFDEVALDWDLVPTGRGDFDVHLRLCTPGSILSFGPGTLELRLSDDTILNTRPVGHADPLITSFVVPRLVQAAIPCASFSAAFTPPPGSTGPYTLFARYQDSLMRGEVVEERPLVLGDGPDLAVREAAWEGPAGARVRICNDGTQPAGAQQVGVYASTDEVLEPSGVRLGDDPLLDTLQVDALAPAECATLRVLVDRSLGRTLFFVPDFARVVNELDEAGGVAALVDSAPTVDLVLEDLKVIDQRTSWIVVAPRVCNRGSGESPPTTVHVQVRNYATGQTTLLGAVPVPALGPNACASPYGAFSSSSPASFLAAVDPLGLVEETDEFNNTYDYSGLTPATSTFEFDWLLYPTLYQTPDSVGIVRACNRGDSFDYPGGRLWIQAAPLSFGSIDPMGYLHPDRCGVFQVWIGPASGPVDEPTHQEFDWVSDDPNTSSFDAAGRPFAHAVFGAGPDLAMRVPTIAGGVLTVEVCNSGNQVAPSSVASVRLTRDLDVEPMHTTPHFEVARVPVPQLAVASCASLQVPLPAPTPTIQAVVVVLDDAASRAELITRNNGARGPNVGLGPDLRINGWSLGGPLGSGALLPQVEICNVGLAPSGMTTANVSFSLDRIADGVDLATTGDPVVGWFSVWPLDPGACATMGESLAVPPIPEIDAALAEFSTAPIWAWIALDPEHLVDEVNEANNASSLLQAPYGYGPDLTVRSVTSGPYLSPNALEAEVEVCNDGNGPSGPTQVEVNLSLLEAWNSVDYSWALGIRVPVGTASVPSLAPGACATRAVGPTTGFPQFEGLYRLSAIVDGPDVVAEVFEDNNRIEGDAAVLTTLGELSLRSATMGFDLDGHTVVTIEVCNVGVNPLNFFGVQLVLSADQTYDPSEVIDGNGWGALAVGACDTFASSPLEWTAPQWPLTEPTWLGVHLGPDGDPTNDDYWITLLP